MNSQWDQAKYAEKVLPAFQQGLLTRWATDEDRILGHPQSSSVPAPRGTPKILELSRLKPPRSIRAASRANIIDLGTKYTSSELKAKFCPNPKNSNNFGYPYDRLLKLDGTISDSEMLQPKMYDENGDPCIIVLKRGYATGLTIGRANTLMHYTCKYFGRNESHFKEWAILPFDDKSGGFPEVGDSGSIIVDGTGCIGGRLTGGCGEPNEIC